MKPKYRVLLTVLLISTALAGCKTTQTLSLGATPDPVTTGSVEPIRKADDPTAPVDEDLQLGRKHFADGDYGLAEKYFRRAVEENPDNAEAWLGLAASYDKLKRFDLADPAYGETVKLVGETPEVLNNRGYSWLLRGDYRKARRDLKRALSKDPENPHIKANLELLKAVRSRRT
ncbi:MAG TPA: tetratricopeptide repeat protein [Rhodobacteraceae bacterium]|nr:tetratricopeptide repeat protein [Paracoccaceae bacterium]